MWLNATHAPDCQEAPNDISVRADDREDEAPAGSGDVGEWKECIPPLVWGGRTLWAEQKSRSKHQFPPGWMPSPHTGCVIHKNPPDFTPTSPTHTPSRINQRHTFICLHQARLRAIIAAVPENNLTWLCVSMATGPMSVAVSPLPVYICNYQQRLQRRDWRNERKRRFSSTRWFKMWSCSSTGYFY